MGSSIGLFDFVHYFERYCARWHCITCLCGCICHSLVWSCSSHFKRTTAWRIDIIFSERLHFGVLRVSTHPVSVGVPDNVVHLQTRKCCKIVSSVLLIDPRSDSDKDDICAGGFYMEHKRYFSLSSWWGARLIIRFRSLCGVHVPDHQGGAESSRCVPRVFLLHLHCVDGVVAVMTDNFWKFHRWT